MLVILLQPGSASRRARAVVREALRAEGLSDADITDAETVVAELAANAETHAHPPYEIRIFSLAGVPTWCELVDGEPDLGWIPAILDRSSEQTALDLFPGTDADLLPESGRGLFLVRELTDGHCRAYATTAFATDAPAKAVAFALPTCSGTRLTCPPMLRLARHRVRLQR
ncbi:ATP-binding protein [Planomonospora parontospora]|uniref:ATP-binding protein n=1 Tax=Planomonospora parontospora TaxID=58119 RepID=UPI001E40CDD8|nr:ATP-binding protein [Planomonospora parontospora]